MSDLLMGLIALALGQLLAFPVQAIVLAEWRKRRALGRLRAEYREGDRVAVLRDASGGPPLMKDCRFHSIGKGRVEFRTEDDKQSLVVTGAEAESLHPILSREKRRITSSYTIPL